jgi:hypothetical protein
MAIAVRRKQRPPFTAVSILKVLHSEATLGALACVASSLKMGDELLFEAQHLSPNAREFLKDIIVVVIGVLVALALNQMVENASWRGRVGVARNGIHREMEFDLAALADWLRVAPCIDQHINQAEILIDAAAQSGRIPRGQYNLEPTGRLLLHGEFDAQNSAQTLVHFPPDELSAMGVWYDQLRNIMRWNEEVDSVWAQLHLLENGGRKLSAFDISLLRRDLQTAKDVQFLLVLNSKRQIARAKQLGVFPGRSRVDWTIKVCARA